MQNILKVIPNLLPIFILLGIGYSMKKTNFISTGTVQELNKFLLNISIPALLFKSFLEMEFKFEYAYVVLLVYTANVVVFLLGKVLNKALKINNPYFPLLMTGFAAGAVGIPLFGVVYGMANISIFGIIQLGQEFYVGTVILPSLVVLAAEEKKSGNLALSFLKNPIMMSIAVGFILNLAGVQPLFNQNILLAGVMETIGFLAQLGLPLILITIGYKVKFEFKEVKLPLITLGCRFVILISLASLINEFIFARLLGLNYLFKAALLTLFILPPSFLISLFVPSGEKEDQVYVDNTVSLAIVCSLVLFVGVSLVYA